jgi:hypothetical protein
MRHPVTCSSEEPGGPRATRAVRTDCATRAARAARAARAVPAVPGLALAAALALFAVACAPLPSRDSGGPSLPESDFRPPTLLEAGPSDGRTFSVLFDEAIQPVSGSFGLEPAAGELSASAEGAALTVSFAEDASPGLDYSLAGEVEDASGNRCRFVLSFTGYNSRPALLCISELQPQKNSSTKASHRDYVEFLVLGAGNLGGLELSWASSTKLMAYRFPAAEVLAGDYLVLHLAPEGLASEVDETGSDLAASGGIDATATARDFWSSAGGLPDESGALALRTRPGGPSQDALFYAADDKSGAVGEGKLADLLSAVGGEGAWVFGGKAAAWEDAFRWHPSAARSIYRIAGIDTQGAGDWLVSEASGQTPGGPN